MSGDSLDYFVARQSSDELRKPAQVLGDCRQREAELDSARSPSGGDTLADAAPELQLSHEEDARSRSRRVCAFAR